MPPDPPPDVSRETSEKLILFTDLLLKWSQRINLIGPREHAHIWPRHINDSLRLVPIIPEHGRIADLGSGAGFPGLILAIVLQRPVTLVESDQRKATFLREAGRITMAPVTVISDRIEACGLTQIDIVTARALAPLPRLFELIAPIIATDGVCLLLKGAEVETELTAARREWQMTTARHGGHTTGAGCILEVKHLRRIHAETG